jgi:hypothetical protein
VCPPPRQHLSLYLQTQGDVGDLVMDMGAASPTVAMENVGQMPGMAHLESSIDTWRAAGKPLST